MRLKVLSYNIHKGLTLLNRSHVLEKIRVALRRTNADILFLQEVLGNDGKLWRIPDSETRMQFEYLADNVWSHYAYGKNAIYPEGHHGNAILSKFPITQWSNVTMLSSKRETRGLLKARVHIPEIGQELILANTHLDLTQKGRDEQTKILIDSMKEDEELPWILVGDFNDWNKKISPHVENELGAIEVFKFLEGKYPATFPSLFPFLSLDRIFLHKLKPIRAETFKDASWNRLSDHIPLFVEIDLSPMRDFNE